jgi:hypothetical protein
VALLLTVRRDARIAAGLFIIHLREKLRWCEGAPSHRSTPVWHQHLIGLSKLFWQQVVKSMLFQIVFSVGHFKRAEVDPRFA